MRRSVRAFGRFTRGASYRECGERPSRNAATPDAMIPAPQIMRAVILAGGEGTRLRPLTLSLPKPVVPVVDRPFLRHQLDLLAGAGVRDVVFSVAYRPERVEAVFGDGRAFGVTIRYAVEDTPLGTGGAVRNALAAARRPHDRAERRRAHRRRPRRSWCAGTSRSGASATILLTPVPNPSAYGLVETDAAGRVLPLPREAEARGDHDRHHQRRHLRARDARRST